MEPILQDFVTHHDGADGFAFTATSCRGAVRLRASGRRTLVVAADHHEHKLHIQFVIDHEDHGGGEDHRVLRGKKSGGLAEFLDMHPARRAKAVAGMVSRARFPPGCAAGVQQFCARAAACGREKLCDDVTVAVEWRPDNGTRRAPRGEAAGATDDAGADSSSLSPMSCLPTSLLSWLFCLLEC